MYTLILGRITVLGTITLTSMYQFLVFFCAFESFHMWINYNLQLSHLHLIIHWPLTKQLIWRTKYTSWWLNSYSLFCLKNCELIFFTFHIMFYGVMPSFAFAYVFHYIVFMHFMHIIFLAMSFKIVFLSICFDCIIWWFVCDIFENVCNDCNVFIS